MTDKIIVTYCKRCNHPAMPVDIWVLDNGDQVCIHCLTVEDRRMDTYEEKWGILKGKITRALNKVDDAKNPHVKLVDCQIDYKALCDQLFYSLKAVEGILEGVE